jgi:hypothetical protein
MPRMVWCEVGLDGRAVRIFKNRRAAVECSIPLGGAYLLRASAVSDIRRQIWERDKKKCVHCGNTVPYGVFEMHERVWRGRGGEVSVENGVTLCSADHQNDKVAGHGTRQVQWTK